MDKDLFEAWCRDATRLIRFTPDRRAVQQELMAHLEDHRDALIAQGLSEERAQEAAIAAMGDPWELSNQLAQVHPPFWGYAHKFTRTVALVLCALLVLNIVFFAVEMIDFYQRYNDGGQTLDASSPYWSSTGTVPVLHPNISVFTHGYYLRIANAIQWKENGETRLIFYFQSYHLPTRYIMSALSNFYAVDDQGNCYDTSDLITFNGVSVGPCCRAQKIEIRLLSDDLQWLELRYDRDGQDLAFPISLTGGETP